MPRPKKDNTDRLYFSARLSSKLEEMLTARTTLISAPAGYGKTTAARSFFNNRLPKGAELLWLTCIDESPSGAWERLCRQIQKIDAEAGGELLRMGLPDEDTKGDAAFLLMEMECTEETFLVIDDFQYMKNAVPDTVWNALMEYGAENLHTVILTRAAAERRITMKPGVLFLGLDAMRLSESEIGEYFAQAGVTLTPDGRHDLSRRTEGWIIALNLQMKSYLQTGSFIDTADIHRLIREIVWDRLTKDERRFMLRVSPFDSYTFRQAAHMMEASEPPEYAKALSLHNDFIHGDPQGLRFRPHSTLLDFIRGVFCEAPEQERRDILTRAGDWCADEGQPEQAMYFYHRLGDYEKILSLDVLGMEFERTDGMEHTDMLLGILENTSPEMKLAHSECVIKIIFMLFGPGFYEQFGRWCAEMSAIAAENDLPEAEAHFNRGEMEDAAVLAHKALYQAENKRQECVCIGAALLLGRLAVYRGDCDELTAVLEQRIARYAAQNPLKSNRMEADLATAFLMGMIDRPQEMAEWILGGDISEKRLFAMSIPYAQIVFGRYMIQSGKPEIWLGMEDGARELANTLRCRMADIYGYILTAAARRAQGRTQDAAAALKAALDAALPDRLYMPFAENRCLLGALLEEHCPPAALKEILALAAKQEAGKAAILRELDPPRPFGLTQREYEVARLAVQSLTIPQIADKLMIARSTAKGYMKNIYQKLQVSSRSELNNILGKS